MTMHFTSPNDLVGYHMIMSVSRLQPIWLNITENLLTLLNAFLNGHRFCTSNGTVPFEVANNRMNYTALPAGCRIICRQNPRPWTRRCACRRSGIATRGSAPLSYSCAISSSLISISSKTTGLRLPSCHHRAFRRRSVAVTSSIALALAPSIACRRRTVRRCRAAAAATPPPRRRQAAADVAQSRCRHRR